VPRTPIGREPETPALVLFCGARPRTFPLRSDAVTVGTAADNDVVIRDPTVSRHHFVIVRRPSQPRWRIFDLDSTNGVWINDRPAVHGHPIHDGDMIRIGRRTALVLRLTPRPEHGTKPAQGGAT